MDKHVQYFTEYHIIVQIKQKTAVGKLNPGLMSHFKDPRNVGEVTNADAAGKSGSTVCNNHIRFTARIKNNVITDIRFKAFGCSYTIAASSCLTELVKNKDILESTKVSERELEKCLGKFPDGKKPVLAVTINALQNLVMDYISNTGLKHLYKESSKKVAVALSGGIDSSMAAMILKKEGWDIFGITMKFLPDDYKWKDIARTCCSRKDIESARKVCIKLGVPHIVVNMIESFEDLIINPFCSEYMKGRTPNPCIECNRKIKFGLLLDRARMLGACYLATGHYCRIEKSGNEKLFEIRKGIDHSKDQSYVLWRLDQEQASKIKTPMGRLLKEKVKKEVKATFTFLEKKAESQDICFIPEADYHEFLKSRLGPIGEGKILNTGGETIGTHGGHPFYTIGQRKGLGISHPEPLYVIEIIPEKNIIVAGEKKDLRRKSFLVKDTNFIAGNPPARIFKAMVKIRYNFKETAASIKIIDENRAEITFSTAQESITPGQSAVFYIDDILVGGGIII